MTLTQALQVDNKGGGDPKVTPNGKRLININNNFKLKILSKSPKCKGKWTRINTKNENEKSIIDYALYTQAPTHSFTEAQVGAREGRSSVEQLFILKSVIQLRTFQRKQTYCTYTWREGMFYNLWQRGVRGKIWRVMCRLCQDQVTTINKYEPRNEIDSENGLRQGKVLSGPEFGAIVDEVKLELRAEGLGKKYGHLMISSLLFMDDITITSSDADQLKNTFTVLEYVCNKWHLKIKLKL